MLTSSEPVPGSPADLMSLLKSHHSQTHSVIEQEELTLSGGSINACLCVFIWIWIKKLILFVVFSVSESCFLSSNDLTHSLSSYLKEGEMLFYALFPFLPPRLTVILNMHRYFPIAEFTPALISLECFWNKSLMCKKSAFIWLKIL